MFRLSFRHCFLCALRPWEAEEILPSSPPFSYLSVVGCHRRAGKIALPGSVLNHLKGGIVRFDLVMPPSLSPPDPGLLTISVPQFRVQMGTASALQSFMLALCGL